MLCPRCRRMVGKDGYCPLGHLARPELQMEPPRAPPPPMSAAPPVPPPPASPEAGPYTPPGLGPSTNPSPQPATTVAPPPEARGAVAPPPPVPGEHPPVLPAPTKRRGKAYIGIIGGGLLLVLLGLAVLGRSAGAANLKYVFTRGEQHRYQASMSMKVSGGNLLGSGRFDGTVEMLLRQKVARVGSDGVATIEFSVDKLTMTERGKTRKVPVAGDVLSIKMTPDGRILDITGNEPLQDINPAAGIFGPESFAPALSRHKVEPGDSWSIGGDIPNPYGKSSHVDGRATFLQRSGSGDDETAVIKSVIDSPLRFTISFAKLAESEGDELPAGFGKNASMAFDGHLSINLHQTIATKTGMLRSALGDMTMTGTLNFDGVPNVASGGVLDIAISVTVTQLS